MKLYVTSANTNELKSKFINLKYFHIIDVDRIIIENDIDTERDTSAYLLYEYIVNDLIRATGYKYVRGIIYAYSGINKTIIENLYSICKSVEDIEGLVLFDDDNRKHKYLYDMFEEIIYMPEEKKVKILECTPIIF